MFEITALVRPKTIKLFDAAVSCKYASEISGPTRRSIGNTYTLAAGALPRKSALVTEPEGASPCSSSAVAESPPLLIIVPATCVP